MVLIVKIPSDPSLPLSEENLDSTKGDAIPSYLDSQTNNDVVVDTTVLIRHSHKSAGLYAYSISSTSFSRQDVPNVRATTLAMACGLHSKRFMNDVYIGRLGHNAVSGLTNFDVLGKDIHTAVLTPDLRETFIAEMSQNMSNGGDICVKISPDWLCSGAMENYHDGKLMASLVAAMTRSEEHCDDSDSSTLESESDSNLKNDDIQVGPCRKTPKANMTLCLHCRRPATTLCIECNGAYFCEEPRRCKIVGWSHQSLCQTWKIYVQHRKVLSQFPYFSGWQLPLLQEDCYNSDETYQHYLIDVLKVIKVYDITADGSAAPETTWWSTEIHGWSGGKSSSAKLVDLNQRVSYHDGLDLDASLIPEECRVSTDDIERAGLSINEYNMPILSSWEDWYQLRSIPPSSPVSLLATFPLTIYYAILQHGIVPIMVSQMLDRSIRIHVVGIEKELNFMDFFREIGFLLPAEVTIEMTFIVREDMFPNNKSMQNRSTLLSIPLTDNLNLTIIGGTYGESLDPNFDISGGPPDMIIGLNAGLYAYESWRHVVSYLHNNQNIIGVFTDYNEHSAMNCASLGGSKARHSLYINPFRQPRAMPVNCMNLPQFSNGFIYVLNEQELE